MRGLSALALLSACMGASTSRTLITSESTATSASAPTGAQSRVKLAPPRLRLGDAVRPERYAVTLTLDPAADRFDGTIGIDLELREARALIWLNATEITIEQAWFEIEGRRVPARTVAGGQDFVGLLTEAPLRAGPTRLLIIYKGRIARDDNLGLFRIQDHADTYLYSSAFSATHARRMFPCFDEPAFKVPWRLTLRVPKGAVALANAAIASEVDEGKTKIVYFDETRPISSYLIAFAVGPFELRDAGKAGKKATPLRIAAPRGRAAEARFAAATLPQALERLERYLDTPYPYDKLDLLPVPSMPGAMENPGLITFSPELLLASPAHETPQFRHRLTSVLVHEVAHQWLGDLVTEAWWDDAWLSEAFATFLAHKIVGEWRPDWQERLHEVETLAQAMIEDGLAGARRIREPVEERADILGAFDPAITYAKGAAVLRMFEGWIGEAKFQKGLHRYLAEHGFGNATVMDLLAALSAEAGHDVGPALASFLDQPGLPLLGAELKCAPGEPRVVLTQQRYLPLGAAGTAAQIWEIPVCVRFGAGRSSETACTLLKERTATLALPTHSCPQWLQPNLGATGYYHSAWRAADVERWLASGQATRPERMALAGNLRALVAAGRLPVADALALTPRLLEDPSPLMLAAALDQVHLPDGWLSEPLKPRWAHFVRAIFGARARAIGFTPLPSEDEDTRLIRPRLLSLVADQGADAGLHAQALRRTLAWLDDRSALAPDLVPTVLAMAARSGDRVLWERLHEQARRTRDEIERAALLGALAGFRDPALAQASLALALTDQFSRQQAWHLLAPDAAVRPQAYQFVMRNFDALVARLPAGVAPRLFDLLGPLCEPADRAQVDAFFGSRVDRLGGLRPLRKSLELGAQCAAQRAQQQKSLSAFLQRY